MMIKVNEKMQSGNFPRFYKITFILLLVSGISHLLSPILFPASGIWHPATAQSATLNANPYAWLGGWNAVQFCELDMNLDGDPDLLAFDRHGNRMFPLIYDETVIPLFYRPDTTYISLLPRLHDWVITADYDCDGRMDIFTYGLGGIRVFRNISTSTRLEFELITEMITSWYYSGKIGILVTPVDYPAIADVDGDGDLDILTFFGLGSFVEYHRNLSKERYGTCDSLDYRLETNCWGKFKESEGSNLITLNADCPSNNEELEIRNKEKKNSSFLLPHSSLTKHTGSTLLVMDLNGDGLNDLVLGDVDFPNLIALYNGGTTDTAFMVAYDTLFPSGTRPVDLYDFPVPSYVDLDHDGLKDMLISSFDPQLKIPDNVESVWFYKNSGSVSQPAFIFQSKQLFQDLMIDAGAGSYPVLTDLDQDGLADLLVGCWGRYDSSYYEYTILKSVNTGRISWYRNTGWQMHPAFQFITDDLAGLSSLKLTGLYPSAGDLNGDGAADLLVGQDDGTLLYLENKNSGSIPPEYYLPVFKYMDIDVGESSSPQIFDLDADGLNDLVIGEKNGNLNYYRNTGSADHPSFSFITDSLGKVNVTNYLISYSGYSTPWFFKDKTGSLKLLVGSEEGKVWFFDSIPSYPEATYPESPSLPELITTTTFPVQCGWRSSPAAGYLTDTAWLDLTVGNWGGGVNYFSHAAPPDVLLGFEPAVSLGMDAFTIFPNPADDYISIRLSASVSKNNLTVNIINLYGQTLHTTTFPASSLHEQRLCLNHLPQGFYLVTLTDPGGATLYSSRKLIIAR